MKKVFDEQEIEELLKPYPQPKQLVIRNTRQGMIWQVYNIENEFERRWLTATSRGNGFAGQEVNSELEHAETWPNWRIDGSWQPVLDQLKPGSELVLLI